MSTKALPITRTIKDIISFLKDNKNRIDVTTYVSDENVRFLDELTIKSMEDRDDVLSLINDIIWGVSYYALTTISKAKPGRYQEPLLNIAEVVSTGHEETHDEILNQLIDISDRLALMMSTGIDNEYAAIDIEIRANVMVIIQGEDIRFTIFDQLVGCLEEDGLDINPDGEIVSGRLKACSETWDDVSISHRIK